MKHTHAIVVRVPGILKFEDKKLGSKIDLMLARKQQEDFNDTLREAGVDVIELPPEDGSTAYSLFADDVAVMVNGTALLTRSIKKSDGKRTNEFAALLNDLAWQVVETPEHVNGKLVALDGSDILFTGKEIFVGIRKNGTNMEGVLVCAKTFADFPVIPIPIGGNLPLKYYVSLAANDILSVGKSKEAHNILKKIERDSTFRYKILTVDTDDAVNCLNVNNHLIFRHDLNEIKFRVLQPPTELWGVTVNELVKIGAPFSRFCLMIEKIKS